MPKEMFGTAAVTSASRATVRRGITITSIVLHAAGLAAIADSQLLSPGPIPTPRQLITFEPLPVKIAEVPPPPRRSGRAPIATADAKNVAPVEAPPRIVPDTRVENSGPSIPGAEVGVTHGIGDLISGVVVEHVAPLPSAPPPKPVRLHAGMQPPRKTVNVEPRYPPLAQATHVEGVVILEAVIDASGNVASVTVLRSIPLLDQAAIDAVSQWRYAPALLNGSAVPVIMMVTLNFTLGR